MQENSQNNLKIVGAFATAVVLIVVGYFIYTSVSRSGKIPVVVNAVPGDAKVTMNDVTVGTGTIYLKPGEYVIKATKEGFADYTKEMRIDQPDQAINVPLLAQSEEAKKWAEENESQYLSLEAKAGEEAQKQGEAFRAKNPIVNLLPFENLLYTIGYRADPADPSGNSIIIEIDATEGYRQQAIYQIYQWGYDPTDFKINFRGYENPFKS